MSKEKSLDKLETSNIEEIRHSLSHLLAAAVLEIYPEALPTLGPATDTGFYYDFDLPAGVSAKEGFLESIEQKMREIGKTWKTFDGKEISYDEARKLFSKNPYKLELIEEINSKGEKITIYTSGEGKNSFTDLCRGGHTGDMSNVSFDSWKLDRVAGAYWRGDEKNKMLTRIYGLAFETKEELDQFIQNQEEAKKRDHRKLGKELDFFHIDDVVGLGLPLWHPKGALLWRVIEEFWYKKHLQNGYDLVRTPHIGNRALWETSGHWGFYNKSMYPPIEVGQTLEEKQQNKKIDNSEEYLLKPMNCPFHVEIYNNRPKSYRDLPLRWAECGTVYRFEKKGELSGLTRVRGFTQDDAHIICRKDQVEDELKKVIDFILFIYQSFGFDIGKVKVYLSLRDPENKDKYAGDDLGWKFTEEVLRKVAVEKKLNFKEELGEAAFYGPKLDFKIEDSLGREWQCSTLQFDFNLPERFDMTFVNSEGKQERPYMLHRALFGSYERFIGLLIEHYAGALPFWLSPVQVKIIPVRSNHNEYAKKIHDFLIENDIRSEFDDRDENLGGKVRSAKNEKIPYWIVVGDKEVESKEFVLESLDGSKLDPLSSQNLLDLFQKQIKEKK